MKLETLYTLVAIIACIAGLTVPILALFIGAKVNRVKEEVTSRFDAKMEGFGRDMNRMEDRITDKFNNRMDDIEKKMVTREMFDLKTNMLNERINDIKRRP